MKKSIFQENRKYTFSDYFDMAAPTEEIVAEFGYSFSVESLDLPHSHDNSATVVSRLNEVYSTVFPKIGLNSEIAKREFLIAPLMIELARNSEVRIQIEYPLQIDDKLGGSLDYLLRAQQELLVVEAKKKDMDGGFNQLAAELIALDKYEDPGSDFLYGAVTLGDIWKFAVLRRKTKHIAKNIQTQTIPGDTGEIFSILLGIVRGSSPSTRSGHRPATRSGQEP